MTDHEMDEVLKHAGGATPPDPAVMARVHESILSSLQPVRPLAPSWVWISALLLIFALVAAAGASVLGMYGIRLLDNTQRVVILALLAAGAMAAAAAIAREMVPAGGRIAHPGVLAAGSTAAFLAAFALLFEDYSPVPLARGVSCLATGLTCAAVYAVPAWLILRRGFVLDRVAAGAAAGMLAGLAGLAVLELHCPILNAPHVLVWHVAVAGVSALGGALVGWLTARTPGAPAPRDPA